MGVVPEDNETQTAWCRDYTEVRMSEDKGPRALFKTDEQSSIGRGCVLYAAHFRVEVAYIFYAVLKTAPEGMDEVLFSEGYRNIRETRDLHEELRAVDVSCAELPGCTDYNERANKANEWARRLQLVLGDDYDVVAHGGANNLHLHVELDP